MDWFSFLKLQHVCLVVLWVLIIWKLRNMKRGGSVLLDLDRPKGHKQYLFGGICGAFLCISNLLEPGGEMGINDISLSLFLLSSGVLGIFWGLSHFEIREGGILYLERSVTWEKIESYEWTGENGLFLTLRFRGFSSIVTYNPFSPTSAPR